jgi:hypothetical protein
MAKRKPTTPELPIKTAEITRALRGVMNMGLSIEKIEILPRMGQITVHPGPALVPVSEREKVVG